MYSITGFFYDNLFNHLDFFYYWNLSKYFNYLQNRYLYGDYFLYYSWHFDYFLNYSRNRHYFLYDSLYLDYSRNLDNFLNNLIDKYSLSFNNLFLDNNWNRNFYSYLFNNLLFNWNNFGKLLINNFRFRLNIWYLHLNIDWFFLFEVKGNYFLNL